MRFWLLLKILLHPFRFVQEQIDAWVMRRVKRLPGPIVIGRNRVYIVPTRYGYAFAGMALVMLLGSMNYSNSMGFMLTFLLGGLGLVCMHYTHGNLAYVQLRPGRARPVFAGEIAHFEIQIENLARRPRYSLALAWPRDKQLVLASDVEPENAAMMRIALPAAGRGWLKAGVFSVSTEFPLGLFHAWTWAELDMACLVYPSPAAPGRLPPPASGASGLHSSGKSGQDEFAGLRTYHRGDALKSIHWKSLPKLQSPMVKQFTELLDLEFWLDWQLLPELGTEARLSQLTRWVLDAELQGRNYGLRLPGLTIAPHHGDHHQQECLKALALFGHV